MGIYHIIYTVNHTSKFYSRKSFRKLFHDETQGQAAKFHSETQAIFHCCELSEKMWTNQLQKKSLCT